MPEANTDILSIAKAIGNSSAREAVAAMRDSGEAAPQRYYMRKDIIKRGVPYTAQTLARFDKEGRGIPHIVCGGYKLSTPAQIDAWVERGGPDAFEQVPGGKTFRLKAVQS